jgi:RHS repeat-associated protein
VLHGGTWARTGLPDAIASGSYNASNQQLTFGAATMTYDLNGNLATHTVGSDVTMYTWNGRNQLGGLSGPALTASFGYDGAGRRRTKTVNSIRTDVLHDGLTPVQEGTLPGSVSANLLTGLAIDELLMRIEDAGAWSVLRDALDSTLALANPSGGVTTEYTYAPFGKTTTTGSANMNASQYTGRENDATGLYFYRARYYDPTSQRFIAEDPLEFGGGDANLYAYLRNSPPNATDPLGLMLLPADPSGLGPEWTEDTRHFDPRDPGKKKFADSSGRPLEWHPRQPGKTGWKGRDHWHDKWNTRRHLPPGVNIPDPAPLPPKPPVPPNPRPNPAGPRVAPGPRIPWIWPWPGHIPMIIMPLKWCELVLMPCPAEAGPGSKSAR